MHHKSELRVRVGLYGVEQKTNFKKLGSLVELQNKKTNGLHKN